MESVEKISFGDDLVFDTLENLLKNLIIRRNVVQNDIKNGPKSFLDFLTSKDYYKLVALHYTGRS